MRMKTLVGIGSIGAKAHDLYYVSKNVFETYMGIDELIFNILVYDCDRRPTVTPRLIVRYFHHSYSSTVNRNFRKRTLPSITKLRKIRFGKTVFLNLKN